MFSISSLTMLWIVKCMCLSSLTSRDCGVFDRESYSLISICAFKTFEGFSIVQLKKDGHLILGPNIMVKSQDKIHPINRHDFFLSDEIMHSRAHLNFLSYKSDLRLIISVLSSSCVNNIYIRILNFPKK